MAQEANKKGGGMAFIIRSNKVIVLGFLCFFACPLAFCADKVVLKSGETVEGLIIDKNPHYVVLYAGGQTNAFSISQVARIVHRASSSSPSGSEDPKLLNVAGSVNGPCNSANECIRFGFEALAKREADRAVMFFDAGIRHDGKNAFAYQGLGGAYLFKAEKSEDSKTMLSEALRNVSKALELNDSLASIWLLRAKVLSRLDRSDEALGDCGKALEIAPYSAAAFSRRAQISFTKGDYDLAINDSSKAIALADEKDALKWALFVRATALLRKGDLTLAEVDCDRAIQIDPAYADAYALRAEIFAARKDYDRAWTDVQTAQELRGKVRPVFLEELRKNAPRS